MRCKTSQRRLAMTVCTSSNSQSNLMYYYPIFLNLQERRVHVIGSGRLAEAKVGRLLATGARVRVIAPTVSAGLEELVAAGEIEYVAREYEEGDLDGAFLIISTVNERATNERIFEEANARNVALNVVDDVEHCSFIAPSILRRGDLTIAVSTSGKAPAVAVRLRQQLEEQIGEEYARFLEIVGTLRAPL